MIKLAVEQVWSGSECQMLPAARNKKWKYFINLKWGNETWIRKVISKGNREADLRRKNTEGKANRADS